jgi:hypothetical protein
LDAHHYVIGRLDRWILIVMSFVDHRPLDVRRPLLKLSSGAKLPKRRAKRNTREKLEPTLFLLRSSISILIFCDFRKRLDDLRALLLRGQVLFCP